MTNSRKRIHKNKLSYFLMLFKKIINVNIIIFILVLVNATFLIYILSRSKDLVNQNLLIYDPKRLEKMNEADFFDSPCPDLQIVDKRGQISLLSDYIGNVIVLRFTRFHTQDLPLLVFLDHLGNKYQNEGFRLFVINHLGMNPQNSVSFSCPVIEDDGYISSAFHASLNDTIIIGRDFRIKLKYNNLDTRSLCGQVIKQLETSQVDLISDYELNSIIKRLSYKDTANDEVNTLAEFVDNKTTIIDLFISICIDCPTSQRIENLKKIATKTKDKGIMLLFGIGNDINMIINYAVKNDLYGYFVVGIIEKTPDFVETDYYTAIRLEINPRMLIFKNGKLLLAEREFNEDRTLDIGRNIFEQ